MLTQSFKANPQHITQVAIELDKENGEPFFKVIKMEGRFSRSAFLPNRFFPLSRGRKNSRRKKPE